ncbi:GGDEF domain-containing protein [Deefgea piscis]|uniref:GGDEF domain-containing protein n=1 Tax=Deefgea piscis TaxID=2739061 RepID=A0A6M8SP37_9NEIS|nr:sensor domain-containing diguanylate cyclase [Deefgea piscis]QKJ65300.1 GGDEF domain-containing protein [Deefgea piscis]
MAFRQTIHYKLSVTIALCAILVASISSFIVYQLNYASEIKHSYSDIKNLMAAVEKTAAVAAFSGNQQIATDVVNSLILNPLIRHATINGHNRLLISAGKKSTDVELKLPLYEPLDERSIAGYITLEINTSEMNIRAKTRSIETAISLFILSLLIGLVVYIVVFFKLSRPLTQLSSRLQTIKPATNDRLPKLNDKAYDELIQLTHHINYLLNMVSDVIHAERELRLQISKLEQQFRGIFESANVGIGLLDESGRLILSNPAFAKLLGENIHAQAQISGQWIDRLFAQPYRLWGQIYASLERNQATTNDLQTCNDWLHVIISASYNDEQIPYYQCLIYDISDRKKREEQMRRSADYDHLTGLHNRHSSEKILAHLLSNTIASKNQLAIFMIDLDRFKYINDTYGHEAGDKVLQESASRMKQHFTREEDLIARLGGDEFMIVAYFEDTAQLTIMVQALIDSINRPIEISNNCFDRVGASIGIALAPQHGSNSNTLINKADQAMYQVKRSGRNGFCIYGTPHRLTPQLPSQHINPSLDH